MNVPRLGEDLFPHKRAPKTVIQGAVLSSHGQRLQILPEVTFGPHRMKNTNQHLGADAVFVRQARAIPHHKDLVGDAFLAQELP